MTPEGRFKVILRESFEKAFPKSTESMTGAIGVALGQPIGLPDRYFGAAGGFAWVECKVEGKHVLTPNQHLQLTRLANCGQNAYLFTLHHFDQDRSLWRFSILRFLPGGKWQLSTQMSFSALTRAFWSALCLPNADVHQSEVQSWFS
jgi:hypothetical protein